MSSLLRYIYIQRSPFLLVFTSMNLGAYSHLTTIAVKTYNVSITPWISLCSQSLTSTLVLIITTCFSPYNFAFSRISSTCLLSLSIGIWVLAMFLQVSVGHTFLWLCSMWIYPVFNLFPSWWVFPGFGALWIEWPRILMYRLVFISLG